MKRTNPLVSILVTNYNNAAYIVESLDSAFRQTYKNTEIVVVDDQSTDDSVELVNKFISQHPEKPIVLFVSPENKGCPASKRKSVELCQGDYFVFLDSDDVLTDNAVEKLMEVMMEHEGKFSIVYSNLYECDERLVPVSLSFCSGPIPDGQSNLNSKGGHVTFLTLCSKKCYDETVGFNENAGLAEDQDFYFKMEEVAPVYYVDVPLYYYRKHDHNISYNVNRTVENLYWLMKAKTEAYYRRKKKHMNIPNITKRELFVLRLEYYIHKTDSCRREHQFWVGNFMKVIFYTPFSIRKGLRGMKRILTVH